MVGGLLKDYTIRRVVLDKAGPGSYNIVTVIIDINGNEIERFRLAGPLPLAEAKEAIKKLKQSDTL